MRAWKTLSIATVMAVLPMVSFADSFDGNWLNQNLTVFLAAFNHQPTNGDLNSATEAAGYVLGVANLLSDSRMVCAPPTAVQAQMMAVVQKYLNDHPEQWSDPASTLVRRSLVAAYPCGS